MATFHEEKKIVSNIASEIVSVEFLNSIYSQFYYEGMEKMSIFIYLFKCQSFRVLAII